jgi:two-component system LytT family response regulator
MNPLRLLIADDEPLIRAGMREIASRMPDVRVVGECESGAETIESLRAGGVDLVLLDVRMPDLSGLDVVCQVGPESMPMVIFVTAYDEYAVRAFELNAVDYLLKPFDEERLIAGIEKARERLLGTNHAVLIERLHALLDQRERKWTERLAVRNKDGFEMVLVDAIDWIESADNYVQVHCGDKAHLLSETMTGLEAKLDPARFLRVHRRRIVNIGRIAAIHTMLNGAYEIQLRHGLRLTTGRQYRDVILRLIGSPNARGGSPTSH